MGKELGGKLFLAVLGLSCVMMKPAYADRTLTDLEVHKLTFSALIAPPSAFHHGSSHRNKHSHALQLVSAHRSSVVHNVTYQGHVASAHRMNMHHRRG